MIPSSRTKMLLKICAVACTVTAILLACAGIAKYAPVSSFDLAVIVFVAAVAMTIALSKIDEW